MTPALPLPPTPMPDLDRMALRLDKGRSATPRAWIDPLDAVKQARYNARHCPDLRPAPLYNTYADAYQQLRNRTPWACKRLRMADMLALKTIKETRGELGDEFPRDSYLARRSF